MKQEKNKNTKNKISLFAPGFIIPMLYSTVTACIMGLAAYIMKNPRVADAEWAILAMKAATISLLLSPSALIVCARLGMKHREKYPLASAFYSDVPLFLSVIVIGCQLLYLYSLTIK